MHQGFNLGGTSVNFKQRDSLVIDLRTSKSEGQSNFVNPGAIILGYGNDADITPKLKAFLNVNYIWMMETEPIRQVLLTNHASNEIRAGLQPRISIPAAPDEQHHHHRRRGISGAGRGLQRHLPREYGPGFWLSRARRREGG